MVKLFRFIQFQLFQKWLYLHVVRVGGFFTVDLDFNISLLIVENSSLKLELTLGLMWWSKGQEAVYKDRDRDCLSVNELSCSTFTLRKKNEKRPRNLYSWFGVQKKDKSLSVTGERKGKFVIPRIEWKTGYLSRKTEDGLFSRWFMFLKEISTAALL